MQVNGAIIKKKIIALLTTLFLLVLFTTDVWARISYTPSNVYSGLDYSNRMLDKVLSDRKIDNIELPISRENAAQPMHVYELHASVLYELYIYARNHDFRPPPIVVSTPITYTPTDVYHLTQSIIKNIEWLYTDGGGKVEFSKKKFKGKKPAQVYQRLFEIFYKMNRLNGKTKISPTVVYSHIQRAKEDLQNSLVILSRRLDNTEEEKKRLLITAVYAMHPDGTSISSDVSGKIPKDVMEMVFDVRDKLNALRKRNRLTEIKRPVQSEFNTVKPIDVFLQTQFIIAELNLLKIPMGINSTTNIAKTTVAKTPSDVFFVMQHIDYMLARLLRTL